ncbi:MAG: hypothetical protein ACRC46_03040 [Thermoguttaceae bacterium]
MKNFSKTFSLTLITSFFLGMTAAAESLPTVTEEEDLSLESSAPAVVSDSGELSPTARIAVPDFTADTAEVAAPAATVIAPPTRLVATSQTIRATEIALVQNTQSSGAKPSVKNAATSSAPSVPATLKDQLTSIIATNVKRGVSTSVCEPFDLMAFALPSGADAMVFQPAANVNPNDKNAPKGSAIYSIGSLCWNYACSGKTLLRTDGQNVYARVGRGCQSKPSQFLALLAMSNIMEDYELRVDGRQFTIAHLIKSEREACQRGLDMSLTLVALSFYSTTRETWTNNFGENWSIDAIVTEELNRPVDQGSSDATDWLLGLSAAVQLYEEEGARKTGAILLAEKQIAAYHDFILSVQNEQGLWHPQFFLFRGVSGDLYDSLLTGGHIVRFLAFSMSDDQLKDARMTKAVESLVAALARVPNTAHAGNMNDRQVEAVGVATQALAFYNQRVK